MGGAVYENIDLVMGLPLQPHLKDYAKGIPLMGAAVMVDSGCVSNQHLKNSVDNFVASANDDFAQIASTLKKASPAK